MTTLGPRLYNAAFDGRIDDVQRLLKKGADINWTDKNGATPLFIAAQNGHDIVVKTLVGANAAVDQARNDGATPLCIAAFNGHDIVVKTLLSANAAVNQAMNDGDTPLMIATRRGHLDIVQHLLDAGADVNPSLQVDDSSEGQKILAGATPLLLVAQFGHDKVARALLRHHPNLQATDADGNTALSMAMQRGHATIVRLLQEYISTNPGPQPTPPAQASANEKKKMELVQAVVAGHVAATKALLDQGVDARVTNEDGDGLLHLAVRHGHTQLLQMLLTSSNAPRFARNKDGETPLVLAMKLRHRQLPHLIYKFVHQFAPDEPATAIITQERLGGGSYGDVHMGMYKNKRVAIKSAKHRHAVCDLLAEIDAIQKCNSPYLIELIAASEQYSDYPKLPKLVLEYMDGGDLHQYLDKKREGEPVPFDYSTLEVAWVIANALADLHRNGFMHRDLKSRNVLLSSTNYIKVADFGLTREIDPNMTVGAGTCAWTAPEVFVENSSYNYAADIYSFGVILTELETLQEPYAGMTRNAITAGVCSGRLRPSVSSNCAPWFKALVDDCLSFDPTKRPTAIAIIDRLLLQKSTDLLQKPLSSREATSMALTHSGSSSSSSSMSSSSSRAMSSRIPCSVCKTRHAASVERCSSCNGAMPDVSAKLTLLLKRAKVANAKGFSINLCIDCDICEMTNLMTAATCADPECGEELLDDAEKLHILSRRFDLATSAA